MIRHTSKRRKLYRHVYILRVEIFGNEDCLLIGHVVNHSYPHDTESVSAEHHISTHVFRISQLHLNIDVCSLLKSVQCTTVALRTQVCQTVESPLGALGGAWNMTCKYPHQCPAHANEYH